MATDSRTRLDPPDAPGGAAAPAVPWATVATVLTGMFMAILDSYIVIVASPAIAADLDAGPGAVQWVLAGYQLSYAVVMVTAGRIADLVGRRRVFMAGTVVFVVTSVLCALSPTPGVLVVARLLQGVGAAMVVPQVFTVISLVVPGPARSRVFGVLGVVLGLATVGGQLVGGLLVGADLFGTGWRSVFLVNVPIGVLVLVLAARFVPESRAADARRLDGWGVLTLTLALFALTYPLIQSPETGWPWWRWALLAASVPAFAVFVGVERLVQRGGGDPLLRLRLFEQRSFAVGLPVVVGVYAVITSYYLALSVSMQEGLGLSALQSGLVYAPAAVTFFVLSLVAGRLIPVYGRRVVEVGAVVVTLGFVSSAVTLLVADDLTPALVIPGLMLQSLGGGLLLTPSLNAVLARIEPADVGVASGALSTAQQVGAALGVAVVGGVFFHVFRPLQVGRVPAAVDAFTAASLTVAGIAALVVTLVFAMPRMPTTRGGAHRG